MKIINKHIKIALVGLSLVSNCKGDGSVYEEYCKAIDQVELNSVESRNKFNRKWVGIFASTLAEENFKDSPHRETLITESMALYTSLLDYNMALELCDMLIDSTKDKSSKGLLLMNAAQVSYMNYESTNKEDDLKKSLVRFDKAKEALLFNEVDKLSKLVFISKYAKIVSDVETKIRLLEFGAKLLPKDLGVGDSLVSSFRRDLIKIYSKLGKKNLVEKHLNEFLNSKRFGYHPNEIIDAVEFIDGKLNIKSYEGILKKIPSAKNKAHLIARLSSRLYDENKYGEVVKLIDAFYKNEKNVINVNKLSVMDKSLLTIFSDVLKRENRLEEANMINEILKHHDK